LPSGTFLAKFELGKTSFLTHPNGCATIRDWTVGIGEKNLMTTSKFRTLAFMSIGFLAVVAIGCTRSASTPPASSDSGELSIEEINQRATMDAVRDAILTQTHEPQIQLPTATSTPPPTPSEPTQTPVIVVNSPTPGAAQTQTYVVQTGEWVYSIARKFAVDPNDIIALNNLQYPFDLEVGQEIIIPSAGSSSTGPDATVVAGGTEYIVKTGDSVYSIAQAHGVDYDSIISANGLVFPYNIYPGDRLIIP
jgi:LysM repeat protein